MCLAFLRYGSGVDLKCGRRKSLNCRVTGPKKDPSAFACTNRYDVSILVLQIYPFHHTKWINFALLLWWAIGPSHSHKLRKSLCSRLRWNSADWMMRTQFLLLYNIWKVNLLKYSFHTCFLQVETGFPFRFYKSKKGLLQVHAHFVMSSMSVWFFLTVASLWILSCDYYFSPAESAM